MSNIKIFISVIIILIVGTISTVILRDGNISPNFGMDEFAQCLADKEAVFYGTFWCSYCQSQKKMFGSSQKLLPYVECSTLDGNNQLQVCKDNNIESYPTWEFADGSRLSGEIPLEKLAEKTGCALVVEVDLE